MPEIKVSVSEETLEFIHEEFPDGLSDPERLRTAVNIIRFVRNNNIEGLQRFLREEGLDDLDIEEVAIEGVKRAILESDEFDLEDIASLLQSGPEDDAKNYDS